MDGSIDFAIGLSQGVAWPWPIAVYLFLAGISGGALGVILTMRKLRGETGVTPLFKAASCIALGTILLGMVCLVLDLTNPLFFWRILVFYNPTSVMSVGVMMLLVYIPVSAFLVIYAMRDELCALLSWMRLKALVKLIDFLAALVGRFEGFVCWVGLVFAFGVCAYTGFLISALIRYPLINTAVLPALFVASGVSAGTAGAKLVAAAFFGESRESHVMHLLHKAEWPMMSAEIAFLFMIGMAMLFGYAGQHDAVQAFTTGVWAAEFWIGAVGIGFGVPLVLGLVNLRSSWAFWASRLAGVVGMMCLRLFILYAGQLNSLTSSSL